MNQAYLHIVLVHLPVVLMPVAAVVVLIGMILKNRSVEVVALSMIVCAAVLAVPVFLLGEGAEEVVEHLPGISEEVIEEHEESAELAIWLSGAVGSVSAVALLGYAGGFWWSLALCRVVFVSALAASVSLGYTAHRGGAIRHPEAYSAQVGEVMGSEEDEKKESTHPEK